MINEKMEELKDELKLIRVGDKHMSIKEAIEYIQDEKDKKRRLVTD